MTNRQRLELRASEIRQKLNEFAGMETLTAEQRTETDKLTTEYRTVETQLRAAIAAEPDTETRTEGNEERELRALTERASLGNIVTAALAQQATEGAELELQQHFSLGVNQVPVALLEQRAVTPAPTDVGTSQASIIPYVFPRAAAAYLNVGQPTVPAGERLYPYIATPATVHAPAKNDAAADTTGSFETLTLEPKRLQAEFFYAQEDRARFAGMDSALRMNLSAALSDALDNKIINQFFAAAGGLADPADPTAVAAFATYKQLPYDQIDGRYASVAGDVRFLVGSATYKHAANVYRTNNSDESGLDAWQRVSGGVRVSAHVPAAAGNVQGMLARLNGGASMDAVAPVWDGIEILNDPYTKSANGQIRLVATMLYNVGIVRADAYKRLEVKVA